MQRKGFPARGAFGQFHHSPAERKHPDEQAGRRPVEQHRGMGVFEWTAHAWSLQGLSAVVRPRCSSAGLLLHELDPNASFCHLALPFERPPSQLGLKPNCGTGSKAPVPLRSLARCSALPSLRGLDLGAWTPAATPDFAVARSVPGLQVEWRVGNRCCRYGWHRHSCCGWRRARWLACCSRRHRARHGCRYPALARRKTSTRNIFARNPKVSAWRAWPSQLCTLALTFDHAMRPAA